MSDARAQLAAQRDALAQLPDPGDWSKTKEWIARTKPLVRSRFPEHLADFDEAAREPSWSHPFFVGGTDRWTGKSYDNKASERARVAAANAKIGAQARAHIVACLDGILALAPASAPSVAGGPPARSTAGPGPALDRWFVGIDGSAAETADRALLARCHAAVRALVRGLLAAGAGVVTLVSGDPRIDAGDPDSATTFM